MTSRASSETKRRFAPLLHELWWTIRRYWWVSAVGMLLLFLSTYGWSFLEGRRPDTFVIVSRDAEILPRIMAVLYGVFAAFRMFRFLWSRRECGMTLSVGAARWKQFTLRYLFGLLSVILAVAVPILLVYYLEMQTMAPDPVGVCAHYTAVYMAALMTLTALSYTVGVVIAVLCGHFLPAMLIAAGALAAPYAFLGGLQKVLGTFLFGSPLGESLLTDHMEAGLFTMLEESLRSWYYDSRLLSGGSNPSHPAFIEYAENMKAQVALPTVRMILLWALMAGLSILACLAYCRRPAEQAGKAVAHPVLTHAVSLTCGFGAASLALFLPLSGGGRTVLAMILLAVAFLLAAGLIRLILIRSLRGLLRHCSVTCGAAALCLLFTILLGTGWFGYASYLPEAEDVVSAQISYCQNPTLILASQRGMFTTGYTVDSGIEVDSEKEDGVVVKYLYQYGAILDESELPLLTRPEDVEQITAIHKAILDTGRVTYTGEPADRFEDTVVVARCRVTYRLRNGKTVERFYPYLTLSDLENATRVEDTVAFREAFAENHDGIYVSDVTELLLGDPMFSKFAKFQLSLDDAKALLTAIDTDTASISFDERYFNTGDPKKDRVVGILRFSPLEGGFSRPSSAHPFDSPCETVYLTESYENTLAFLAERDLLSAFENDYTVEEVRIAPYTPRFTEKDRVCSYVFYACENVWQILPPPMSVSLRDLPARLHNMTTELPEGEWDAYIRNSRAVALMTRPGVMVQIKLKNTDGQSISVTRYLYDVDIPSD